ncbi:MAG: leucyl aminopeptidase family protein [Minisyncoccota bacterium]
MRIKIEKRSAEWWQKKGTMGVALVTEGQDGIVRETDGRSVLEVVIGERAKMTRRALILLIRRIVREALAKKYAKIAVDFSLFRFEHLQMEDTDLAELLAVNARMADYAFRDFVTKPKEGWPSIAEIIFANVTEKIIQTKVTEGVRRGIIIGEEVNRARHIATMSGGAMTPVILARHAKDAVKGLPVRCTILDEAEMKRLKMGGVLGVGKGSDEPSRFIVLEYFGAVNKKAKPIVLIGKGVTFDTGGINLKPSGYILGMNMDMSGGASVIHALTIAARLKFKKNIIALIPAVENMPSGSSYRPGDILHSMSGKTIEVLDTDAEGRIILADALHYAKKYKPALVVDVATLTGAAMVALGERATALFTEDENLELRIRHLGEESGDYVWPLPLWEEYDAEIKGTFGDVANIGNTRYGGAITAAMFLRQFVDKAYPWVHLDIAPRMTTLADEFLAKGSAGAPVRLLVKLLEKYS